MDVAAFFHLRNGVYLCFLVCFCRTVFSQDIPKITREIYPEIKRVGMTGFMNCTVARQGTNRVQWIHKDSGTILTSDDRVEIDSTINEIVDGQTKFDVVRLQEYADTVTYQLIVRRLAKTDDGSYTCQVIVIGASENEHPSKTGKLVVLVPPTIHPSKTTQVANILENTNATLACYADGYPAPNISWVRVSGNPLPPPWDRFAYRGNNLPLIDVQNADRGWYRCVADNNVRPPSTYDCLVQVHFKPAVRAVQKTYGQAQNRLFDVTIECIVAGHPAPDMKWYHIMDGGLRPIIDDDKHRINQLLSHGQVLMISENWYQLTIINVQANDYGIYICEGTNNYGSDQLEIQIYETSECQGPTCPPEGGFISSPSHRHHSSLASLIIVMSFSAIVSWSEYRVPDSIMPIHPYVESPIVFTDYNEFKIASPTWSNPSYLLRAHHARFLHRFTGYHYPLANMTFS